MKLSGLSMTELRALREEVENEIQKRETEEIAKAREQIIAIAQSVGISLKELVGGQIRGNSGASKGRTLVRYRHPSDPTLHWSGRGRKPQWVKNWLASGRKLDELNT